jgi:hypothetical protein
MRFNEVPAKQEFGPSEAQPNEPLKSLLYSPENLEGLILVQWSAVAEKSKSTVVNKELGLASV